MAAVCPGTRTGLSRRSFQDHADRHKPPRSAKFVPADDSVRTLKRSPRPARPRHRCDHSHRRAPPMTDLTSSWVVTAPMEAVAPGLSRQPGAPPQPSRPLPGQPRTRRVTLTPEMSHADVTSGWPWQRRCDIGVVAGAGGRADPGSGTGRAGLMGHAGSGGGAGRRAGAGAVGAGADQLRDGLYKAVVTHDNSKTGTRARFVRVRGSWRRRGRLQQPSTICEES